VKIKKKHLLMLIILTSFMGACNQFLSGDASAQTLVEPSVTKGDAGLLRSSFGKCIDASEGITEEMRACIESEYHFHESRADAAYQTLLEVKRRGHSGFSGLSQQEWLSKTEKDCAWDTQHDGEAQRLEAEYCEMRNAAKRADELERKIRRSR
jgi:uncharacterized protein YecT (DUF1311 family)